MRTGDEYQWVIAGAFDDTDEPIVILANHAEFDEASGTVETGTGWLFRLVGEPLPPDECRRREATQLIRNFLLQQR